MHNKERKNMGSFIASGRFAALLLAGVLALPATALAATGQTIIIGGTVYHDVFGNGDSGLNGNLTSPMGPANQNTVKLESGASVDGAVRGARHNIPVGPVVGSGATANLNKVISEGATVSGNAVVVGGEATIANINGGLATAETNEVSITGGTISKDSGSNSVFGGYASSTANPINAAGSASYNKVTLTGVTISGNVYGGQATGATAATASNNTVTINGGSIGGHVFGGNATGVTATVTTASNNTVTIKGSPTFDTNSQIAGGWILNDNGASTNNTLNLHSPIAVNVVGSFQKLNFYVPDTFNVKTDSMISITAGGLAMINDATVCVGIEGGGSTVAVGDKIVLIDASRSGAALVSTNLTNGGSEGMEGISKKLTFDLNIRSACSRQIF